MTGTGLKKCKPITRSGRDVTVASLMTGTDDVFVANTTPSANGNASSRRNRSLDLSDLRDSFDDEIAVGEIGESGGPGQRVHGLSCAAGSSTRLAALRSRPAITRDFPCASASGASSHTVTAAPVVAMTWAIPDPMIPHPITATRSKPAVGSSTGRVSAMVTGEPFCGMHGVVSEAVMDQ